MSTELPKTTETFLRKCIWRLLDRYLSDRWGYSLKPEINSLMRYFTDKLCEVKK